MRLSRILTSVLISAAVGACASAPSVTPDPNSDAARTQAIMARAKRWTGTFNPTGSVSGELVPSVRQNGNGNVELTPLASNPNLSHVHLSVSVSMDPSLETLGWAIHGGGCGSGDPPVLAPGAFPLMQVNANGQANLDVDMPFALWESGSYHVNVFRGTGTQLTDVITCAQLRRKS